MSVDFFSNQFVFLVAAIIIMITKISEQSCLSSTSFKINNTHKQLTKKSSSTSSLIPPPIKDLKRQSMSFQHKDVKEIWKKKSFKIPCENIRNDLNTVQMIFLQHSSQIQQDADLPPKGICSEKKLPERFRLCQKYALRKYREKDHPINMAKSTTIAVGDRCKLVEIYLTDFKREVGPNRLDIPGNVEYYVFDCMLYRAGKSTLSLDVIDFSIVSEGVKDGTVFVHEKLIGSKDETNVKAIEHVVVDNNKDCKMQTNKQINGDGKAQLV